MKSKKGYLKIPLEYEEEDEFDFRKQKNKRRPIRNWKKAYEETYNDEDELYEKFYD